MLGFVIAIDPSSSTAASLAPCRTAFKAAAFAFIALLFYTRSSSGPALERLRALAAELDRSHPGAAASLREGLEETFTLQRLGIRGSLKQTLASTNPCESMIECVRRTSRNVKRWQSGEMALRWTAAGMLEAERQFRRVIAYRDPAKLAIAIEHDLARTTAPPATEEAAILVNA